MCWTKTSSKRGRLRRFHEKQINRVNISRGSTKEKWSYIIKHYFKDHRNLQMNPLWKNSNRLYVFSKLQLTVILLYWRQNSAGCVSTKNQGNVFWTKETIFMKWHKMHLMHNFLLIIFLNWKWNMDKNRKNLCSNNLTCWTKFMVRFQQLKIPERIWFRTLSPTATPISKMH